MGIIAGNIIAAIPMTHTTSKRAMAGQVKEDTIAATPVWDIMLDEPLLIIIGIR
jgi:hypothetical protein